MCNISSWSVGINDTLVQYCGILLHHRQNTKQHYNQNWKQFVWKPKSEIEKVHCKWLDPVVCFGLLRVLRWWYVRKWHYLQYQWQWMSTHNNNTHKTQWSDMQTQNGERLGTFILMSPILMLRGISGRFIFFTAETARAGAADRPPCQKHTKNIINLRIYSALNWSPNLAYEQYSVTQSYKSSEKFQAKPAPKQNMIQLK